MRPELDMRNVQLVTLCMDTPKQLRKGIPMHNVQAIMLSDTSLAVTRLYDIENVAPKVKPPGLESLPIPTTVLIDAEGIVRWIDQADDYQVRSQPDRVLAALNEGLAPA